MAKDKKISKNFTLSEFLRSRMAIKASIDMTPSAAVEANLKKLVDTVLQPLRDHLKKPIVITSGYRPQQLNIRIGGARTSAHLDGRAADFYVPEHKLEDVAKYMMENMSEQFDQIIIEHGRWIHVQIAGQGKTPRKRALTAYRDGNITRYAKGLKPELYT